MSARSSIRGLFSQAYLGDGRRDLARGLHRFARAVRRAPRTITFYARVDDPKTLLVAEVLPALVEAYGLVPEVVIVPAPAADVDPEPELRARFDLTDARLLADAFGLVVPEPGTEPVASRVRLANAILLVPRPPHEALALVRTVGEALLSRDGERLSELAEQHGAIPGQEVRPRLEASYARLRRDGHYESGVVGYEGEFYDGVDRLHYLESRLVDEGLGGERRIAPRLDDGPTEAVAIAGERIPVDLWFSFRSPYSYLALERLARWAERYPVALSLRPVLPMVMRGLPVPETKRLYIVKDAKREADRQGVLFGRICDPVGAGVERCLAVFFAAEREGQGLAFARSAMRGIWAEAVDVATDEGLFEVAARAGLGASLIASALADASSYKAMAESHREELYELGYWGVPVVRVGAFTTWGQDRLPLVEARLLSALAQARA